jgi:hypothetical protein
MRKILRGAPQEKLPLHGLMEIGTTASELLPAMINWLNIEPYEHLALLLTTNGRAGLFISIFNMFFAVVDVTSKPDKYGLADLRDEPAKALLLDARNLDFTETTLAVLAHDERQQHEYLERSESQLELKSLDQTEPQPLKEHLG